MQLAALYIFFFFGFLFFPPQFFDNYMMYENEIGLYSNDHKGAAYTSPIDPDYRWRGSSNPLSWCAI